MKYEDWLKSWLGNYVRVSLKYRTYVNYSERIEKHVIPNLGECELNELTSLKIQCFVRELAERGNVKTGKGLALSTINGIITIIGSSLDMAYAVGVLENYPKHVVKRPKVEDDRVRCFSVSDQKKIETAILGSVDKKPRMFGVILSLYTGMRIGELLALEWSDIDFRNEVISVTKTCYYGKTPSGCFGRMTDKPKTHSSSRLIPLPKQLVPFLKELKKNSKSVYVVSNGINPVAMRSYQASFSALLKKINVPHESFHTLRHTFATRAIECGMDVKSLSEILGHKNPSITLKKYVHSFMRHKKEMMNKVGKLL